LRSASGTENVRLQGDGIVQPTEANTDTRFLVYDSLEDFAALESAWNQLALRCRSPFVTHEWLRSWWSAFGGKDAMAVMLRGAGGSPHAGAGLLRQSGRVVGAAANVYSEDWDAVAVDDTARRLLWRQIAALSATRLTLPGLPADSPSVAIASDALRDAGYRVAVARQQLSPYVALPETWDELLATLSRNERSQVRRKMKRLEREGRLVFRTTTGPDLDGDLDRFFRLEASGWKGAANTAILNDPQTLRLYTDFAHAAASRGWLRLHLLELDGVTVAADYTCVLGDAAFLLKTCFDERYARLSPGAVLRSEALRTAIEEGLAFYEFLGGPDRYKLQWGGDLRERLLVRAYRGSGLPTFVYRHKLRPVAGRLRALVRSSTVEGPPPTPPGSAGPS
jgi:CelD/BcsL family acetyltransferase involved in cellulose biosynthesis